MLFPHSALRYNTSTLLILHGISCDSHLPIQLLELEMECIKILLVWHGNKLETKEDIVKGVGDTSIKKLKA